MSAKQGKLRSLKEFLTSTKSLNQSVQSQRYKSHQQLQNESASSMAVMSGDNKKNSVSLFDLVEPINSRPNSMYNANGTFNGNAYKSVSTYGLSNKDRVDDNRWDVVQRSASTSKNPAVRLYYTIVSKFRRRKRDRGNKVVDSKQDFGAYIPSHRLSNHSAITLTAENANTTFHSSGWNESSQNITGHPRSMHNLDQVDLLEDAFMRPLGYRDDPDVDHRAEVEASSSTNNNLCVASTSASSAIIPSNNPKEERNSNSEEDGPPLRSKALTAELCDLLHYGWYWGGLSKEEADEKLKGEPDGAFIVRDSSSDHYLLSLSFNSNGRTLHTRIEYRNGLFCFYSSETECFSSVAKLIDYCTVTSQQGAFCFIKSRRADAPPYPVRLTQYVSRFTEVKSLKYLSRFVIRQYVRLDLIPQLPLPQTLVNFICEPRYI